MQRLRADGGGAPSARDEASAGEPSAPTDLNPSWPAARRRAKSTTDHESAFKRGGVCADEALVHPDEFDSVLTGAVEGSEWAWACLYNWLSPGVLGYLRARGATEAEDLLGEVWHSVARRIHSFEGTIDSFRSWVFLIAHHRVIDERRRRNRQPLFEQYERVRESVTSLEALAESEGDFSSLDLSHLTGLISDLPELQQSVLLLRIVADMSVEQTADVLDIKRTTVTTAQHRALAALRKKFGKSVTRSGASSVTEVR